MPDTLVPYAELPDIDTARLPATYDAAKHALAECSQLDECQTWANKAEAMASYARQANDDALRIMCDRIQARAIRRCGELLREIRQGQGARDGKRQDGDDPPLTRTQAATNAGLSERQRKTALRVANIPEDEFESAIESDDPPTVTALADHGKVEHAYLKGRQPSDFERATRLIGLIDDIWLRSTAINLDAAARGLDADEREHILDKIPALLEWLDILQETLENAVQPR